MTCTRVDLSARESCGAQFDGVEDMYGSVEQFVQLTEEELRTQVAAAESLIKKSLQLRMGHAVAEPVQQGVA